jgi:hypothetical protein
VAAWRADAIATDKAGTAAFGDSLDAQPGAVRSDTGDLAREVEGSSCLIPDPELARAVADARKAQGDAPADRVLHMVAGKVTSLQGIECLTALDWLTLDASLLTDFSLLARLPNLTRLTIRNFMGGDFSPFLVIPLLDDLDMESR